MSISTPNRYRNVTFQLRLSEQEADLLEAKTKKAGLRNRSDFLRRLIIYSDIYIVDYDYIRQYNEQLARIGNNLNQIAKRANENGLINSTDLHEAKEIMNQIWHTQKSMLSKQPLINP